MHETTFVADPRGGFRPRGWLLYLLFIAYPLWWALGFGPFIWPLVAVPMMLSLLFQGRLKAPRGFGIWLLFLLWALVTATQLTSADRVFAFVYRTSLYLSATVLFLYVYNAPPRHLGVRKVVFTLAAFWGIVVVGGFLGLAFPHVSFRTVTERALPRGFATQPDVNALVHPKLAQLQRILPGYPAVPRPAAPFPYANGWGANFALLTPFALTAWTMVRSRTRKWALGGFMVASLFPFVVSLDRGAWFSLGLGLAYATLRFGLRGNRRALAGAVAALVLGVGVVALTPLGGVVVDRLKNPHSNEGRMLLYQEAIKRTKESPVLGYGAPVKSVRPDTPSVGTHGQLWLVLVSHGVPAALLFFAWWIALLLRTRRGTAPFGVWGHAVVLISLLQMGFYEQLAAPIHITMVAAALVLREMRARQEGSAGQIAVQVRELSTVGG